MTSAASSRRSERRAPPRQVGHESLKRAEAVLGASPANISVTIRNRQRTRALDLRLLRAVVRGLFNELPQVRGAELGVFLVAAPEMARLNETFLQHAGSTDVITFDYADHASTSAALRRDKSRITHHASRIQGEIIICVDEALTQARRFRTTWQSELVRYVVHGVLHLLGHDDRRPAARRTMKLAENRLLRSLATAFDFREFSRPSGRNPHSGRSAGLRPA